MPRPSVKSPYETYSQWQARTFCDNASSRGTGVGISPQCTNGKREFNCTIFYNDVESDSMTLCKKCKDNLRKEARRHGYRFKAKRI